MRTIRRVATVALLPALAGAGCASGPAELPEPRPLVIHSGERLSVDDQERLRAIYETLTAQAANIEQDPSFLIVAEADARDVYPWETLEISPSGDTATVHYKRTVPDILTAYEVYAHLHLMHGMDRLDEWLPEAVGLEGWDLERAIVGRVADTWLLGRVTFDLAPYELLDRLIYAQEAGQLDALLLTLRASEFSEARQAWLDANPGADEAFRAWYRETFAEDPPPPPGGA
jgi:hypothetical protein